MEMDLNNPLIKQHADNFLKYLDDMAANNPEEYKKFIGKQLKQGFDSMGGNIKSVEEIKIKCEKGCSLRFKVKSKFSANNNVQELKYYDDEKTIVETPKIMFSFKFNKDLTAKCHEDPKVYLNIVHSNSVKLPMDSSNNPCSVKEFNKWSHIPCLYRTRDTLKSLRGIFCDIYDVAINSEVWRKCVDDENVFKATLTYIVKSFHFYLKKVRKYEIFLDSVKIVKEKKYKGKTAIPEDFLIPDSQRRNVDDKLYLKSKPDDKIIKPEEKISKPESKLIIPPTSENVIGSANFYAPKGKNSQAKSSKKVLIEEIPVVKNILTFTLKDNQNSYEIHINLLDNISIGETDLEVSNKELKFYHKENKFEVINVIFEKEVDNDSVIAKYTKDNKVLRVEVNKI